jgi:hypothetical protein
MGRRGQANSRRDYVYLCQIRRAAMIADQLLYSWFVTVLALFGTVFGYLLAVPEPTISIHLGRVERFLDAVRPYQWEVCVVLICSASLFPVVALLIRLPVFHCVALMFGFFFFAVPWVLPRLLASIWTHNDWEFHMPNFSITPSDGVEDFGGLDGVFRAAVFRGAETFIRPEEERVETAARAVFDEERAEAARDERIAREQDAMHEAILDAMFDAQDQDAMIAAIERFNSLPRSANTGRPPAAVTVSWRPREDRHRAQSPIPIPPNYWDC